MQAISKINDNNTDSYTAVSVSAYTEPRNQRLHESCICTHS